MTDRTFYLPFLCYHIDVGWISVSNVSLTLAIWLDVIHVDGWWSLHFCNKVDDMYGASVIGLFIVNQGTDYVDSPISWCFDLLALLPVPFWALGMCQLMCLLKLQEIPSYGKASYSPVAGSYPCVNPHQHCSALCWQVWVCLFFVAHTIVLPGDHRYLLGVSAKRSWIVLGPGSGPPLWSSYSW